jgi:hypothetical protein
MARSLKDIGCRITPRCGLHVHVGVKSENADFFRNLLRAYGNNANHINRLHPPSRHHNRFCQSFSVSHLTDAMTKEEILRAFGHKFVKVSLQAYTRQGTIEFRQAAGTVDADKACYWIKFCLRLCLAARAGLGVQRAASLEEFLNTIGCTDNERTYLLHRAQRLAPQPTGAVA